jgi:hypothetical protein
MGNKQISIWRSLLLMSLLLGVLFGFSPAPTAMAALGGCRADPVFVLSDGTILDVTVDIGTAVGNVTEIHYVVHGPRGVTLITAISTPTIGFKGLERVTYIADGAPNQFITDSLVKTKTSNVSVAARTIFVANGLLALKLSLTAQYRTVYGFSGQHLISILNK